MCAESMIGPTVKNEQDYASMLVL
jgi:Zn-dependent M16 (insulinase) family peptidase